MTMPKYTPPFTIYQSVFSKWWKIKFVKDANYKYKSEVTK